MKTGDVLLDRFEIEQRAGEGGMGAVFRARDKHTGDWVALKAAPAPDEARALSRLDHPVIVRYVAHGEGFVAMEWLDGELLSERLALGPLAIAEVVSLGQSLASALSHAHARGVVHRDLSPRNLLLAGGRVESARLLDFGLALVGGARSRSGVLRGSAGYMAPEQVRSADDVDGRADLFSLGCVLHEALTAQPAFRAEHYLGVLAKLMLAEAPDVRSLRPEAPAGLARLIRRLLEKDPDARPGSAEEVARALEGEPAHAVEAITRAERHVASVVLAGDLTLPLQPGTEPDARTREIAERYSAVAAPLPNGAVALGWSGAGTARDHAVSAVRAALELRPLPVAVATGWARQGGELSTGELIDQAVVMLAEPGARQGVRVDSVTWGLLPARFRTEGTDEARWVTGESEGEPTRRLLGRVVPCIGRERELRTLHAMVDDAFDVPRSQVVLLTGAAGVGKSRVRHELLRAVAEQRPETRVWIGRGDATRAGAPFGILGDALARGLGLRDAIGARSEFLAELCGVSRGSSPQLDAARSDPVLMGDQLRAAFQDLLVEECASGPVLLVLEDFQWGDVATVTLLDAALRNLPELPFFLLVVARPQLFDYFPRLLLDRGAQELVVGPLTRRSGERLLRTALGDQIGAERLDELVRRGNGNAFYLEELARAEVEGRALPDTVLAMVQARLEAMEHEARRVLRAASVFGNSAWLGGIAALLGGESQREEVARWLSTLAAREVVSKVRDTRFVDEPEYAFRHALVRDAAYAMLTDEDRALGHRLAATWLSRVGETDAGTLADHYELGDAVGEALPWLERAAASALDAGDFEQAKLHAERGEKMAAGSDGLGGLVASHAEALRLLGRAEDAVEMGAKALALLEPGSARWCAAAGEQALVLQRLAQGEELTDLARVLLSTTARRGAGESLALSRLRAAIALLRTGNVADANRLANAALSPSDDARPLVSAWSHAFRALSALQEGDRGTFLVEARTARRHHLEVGDERPALEQAINMGSVYVELGRFDQAETMLREALARAERLGLSHARAGAMHNLGLAVARLGRTAEGLDLERSALQVFHGQDKRLEGGVRVSMALIALWSDDMALATREAAQAEELLSDAAPPMVPVALAVRAKAALARGESELALTLAERAMELSASVGVEFGGGLVRLVHVEALRASGDEARAERALARAHTLLLEQADELSDPVLRESFLEGVPENRRTLELVTRPTNTGLA
ncbi:MAG: AAA family ATPase [Myxococcales bacterium]|nr:AAA family ATPase [Myxococcales bacterium]MCB9575782.1 AAA family ATPase [Polyangiaceae bacterium]